MKLDTNSFGKYIKALRQEKNLSLRQVEIKTGISNSYLSYLERGLREVPTAEVLNKLSIAYNTPYESMLEAAGKLNNYVIVKSETLPLELQNLGIEAIRATKSLMDKGTCIYVYSIIPTLSPILLTLFQPL